MSVRVKQISPECGIGMCPAVFELVSECVVGACPTVFEVLVSHCVLGACPAVLKAPDGDLIIVGSVLTPEELRAVMHKIKPGEEAAVRVPRSLIASLKF